jgi:hypothetical protein
MVIVACELPQSSLWITTCLFKFERVLIHFFVGKPSNDQEASELAVGDRDAFVAWRIEERAVIKYCLSINQNERAPC